MVASPYTVHRANEVLWSVRRVEFNINGKEVAGTVLKNLEVVWGVGSVVGCWVANQQFAYIVVWEILERERLSRKGGVEELVDGNLDIMWGP